MLAIVRGLPSYFDEPKSSDEFDRLIGSTILEIGAPKDFKPEGGGLVIRYRLADGSEDEIAFGFNELGMWTHSEDELRKYCKR